jgi:flagellar hook-length control protein FliK
MRGEKPAPQIPQADVPELPPESAKAQASDLPPRAPAQPPIKADLPPPVASPRSEAVPKAAVDPVEPAPVKSGGSERVLADIRFDATLTPRPVLAAAAPQAVNLDLPALAVEIVRHVHAGLDRFQIRLDPPDLGRIDVRIDLDGDRAALKLTVEKSETLDLLQRDARALERALTQAGFNGDRPNLEFALRQQNQQAQDAESSAPPFTAAEAAPLAQRLIVRAGGIDLYA